VRIGVRLALLIAAASAAWADSPRPGEVEEAVETAWVARGRPPRAPLLLDLARRSQSPISDLLALPFQGETAFGADPDGRPVHVLGIQQVVPIRLGRWLVVARRTLPIVHLPIPGDGARDGPGDASYSVTFVPPRRRPGFAWGVGPAFQIPTAVDERLGEGQLAAGPTAAAVWTRGRWVVGAVATDLWTVAGDEDRPAVRRTILQPFAYLNLAGGWFLATSPVVRADWEAASDRRFTVPVGGGVGRVLEIGGQPVSASVQAYANVVKPDGAADWTFRLSFAVLIP
jgi:hypothetical protein